MKPKNSIAWLLLLTVLALFLARHASAQGTAFSYQGALREAGVPANGSYDFQFSLFDASAAGKEIGSLVAALATPVSNGLFSVTIDFGASPFTAGQALWLEIATRTNGAASFTTLAARQQLTPVPFAIYSPQAGAAVTAATAANATAVAASNILGALNLSQLPPGLLTNNAANVSLSGTFTGGGSGLTNLSIPLSGVNAQDTLGLATNDFGFLFSSVLPLNTAPVSVIAADVNGDGHPDILTTDPNGHLTVSTNNGHGGFILAASGEFNGGDPTWLGTADFNGDGKPDLICVVPFYSGVYLLTNSGGGHFGSYADLSTNLPGLKSPMALATNLSAGNSLDIVMPVPATNTLAILRHQGGGAFEKSLVTVGHGPTWVAAADVNHDGKIDLISANSLDGTLSVLTNDGAANFTASAILPAPGAAIVLAVDVNGDGAVDLVTQDGVFLNNGQGVFTLGASLPKGLTPTSMIAADMNGDSRPDLIVADSQNALALDVFTNNGAGSFSSAAVLPFELDGEALEDPAVADLNGDGKNDIVTFNYSALTLWTNGARSISVNLTASGVNGGLRFLNDGQVVNVIDGAANNSVDFGAGGSVIAGGGLSGADEISANDSAIGGGSANWIQFGAGDSVIGGGYANLIANSDGFAVIGGGQGNQASGFGTVIGGGIDNVAGDSDTVGGGENNHAVGGYSTVAGGFNNTASGILSLVAGGYENQATNADCVVAGGRLNTAGGSWASVGGGEQNLATGAYATVPGGSGNSASGFASFAAGYRAQALADGCFVWSDSSGGYSFFSSVTNNSFNVRANGGVQIISSAGVTLDSSCFINPHYFGYVREDALTLGAPARMNSNNIYLTANSDTNSGLGYYNGFKSFAGDNAIDGPVLFGATSGVLGTETNGAEHISVQWDASSVTVYGTFNNSSDRNAKQDFAPVSPSEILDKVARLPLSEWSYKSDASVRHIGPMGQDFHAAFNIGTDERHIAPIDEGGVALAAIQGLNQRLEDEGKAKDAEIAQLRQSVAELKAMVQQLTK